MFRYKINALEALKAAGYTSYKIRQEKIFGQATLSKFRNGELPSWAEFDKFCALTKMQPWDVIEHVPDEPENQ